MRRFPPPWTIEQTPGGYKVIDANCQALAYVYARDTLAGAELVIVIWLDEGGIGMDLRHSPITDFIFAAPCLSEFWSESVSA